MQEAGYILLMPGGDWNADTTYHILHLVNHNGASWVCKKDCTGQEPSDSNTEFWQRFGTAVDLANYLPLDGSKPITGNIFKWANGYSGVSGSNMHTALASWLDKDNTTDGSAVVIYNENDTGSTEANRLRYLIEKNGVQTWYDLLHTGNFANHAIAKNGGNAIHVINILEDETGTKPSSMVMTTNNGVSFLINADTDGVRRQLSISPRANVPDKKYCLEFHTNESGQWETFSILHTGNKPSGTYTGNGSATQRVVDVGGIGDFLVITSVYGTAFVTSSGGIMADASTITPFGSDVANIFNGYLSLNSGDVRLNANGVAYKYQV